MGVRNQLCKGTGIAGARGDAATVDIKVVNPNETGRAEVIRVEPRSTMVNVYKYMHKCSRVDTMGAWTLYKYHTHSTGGAGSRCNA